MAQFKYTARDANGTEITGDLNAISKQAAEDSIKAMNLEVVYLQPTEPETAQPTQSRNSQDDLAEAVKTDVLKEQWNDLNSKKNTFKNTDQFAFSDPQNLHETIDTLPKMPADSKHYEKDSTAEYYPFSETIRLYAGWLIAWYGLVYILGYFQKTREVDPAIPFVFGLLYSPLVLTCTLAAFLYLLLHSIQRKLYYGYLSGFFLLLLGILIFIFYRIHV